MIEWFFQLFNMLSTLCVRVGICVWENQCPKVSEPPVEISSLFPPNGSSRLNSGDQV